MDAEARKIVPKICFAYRCHLKNEAHKHLQYTLLLEKILVKIQYNNSDILQKTNVKWVPKYLISPRL